MRTERKAQWTACQLQDQRRPQGKAGKDEEETTDEARVSLMGPPCVPRARGWTEPESSWKELPVARTWGGHGLATEQFSS